MAYTDDELSLIFDRTDGHCHVCWRKLCFANYSRLSRRGAWEVEHSNPRLNGGSDRLCNLYAARMLFATARKERHPRGLHVPGTAARRHLCQSSGRKKSVTTIAWVGVALCFDRRRDLRTTWICTRWHTRCYCRRRNRTRVVNRSVFFQN